MDFLEGFQRLAEDAFRIAAHAILEQFTYAKKPPHLKKSLNQTLLENGTYEQIVTQLEQELDLTDLEAHAELQVNTVIHYATKNSEKPKPTCHHCDKPGHYKK